MSVAFWSGIAAASLSATFSLAQVWHIARKRSAAGLSDTSWLLLALSFAAWLVWGLLRTDPYLIVTNTASLAGSLWVLLAILPLLVWSSFFAMVAWWFGLGAPRGAFAATVAIGGYVAFAWWRAPSIALAMAKARPATGAKYAQLRNVVEEIAVAAGVPAPAVYVVDTPARNAFSTGRDSAHAAVVVTTGLLADLRRDELQGVVAHEIAHCTNRDLAVATFAVVLVGACTILPRRVFGFPLTMVVAWAASRRRLWWRWPLAVAAFPLGLFVWFVAVAVVVPFVVATPVAVLIRFAISRHREALADATAVQLTRNPAGLRSALETIDKLPAGERMSGGITHLWICAPSKHSTPFGHGVPRWLSTHPPIEERIATLRSYEQLPFPPPVRFDLPPPETGP